MTYVQVSDLHIFFFLPSLVIVVQGIQGLFSGDVPLRLALCISRYFKLVIGYSMRVLGPHASHRP